MEAPHRKAGSRGTIAERRHQLSEFKRWTAEKGAKNWKFWCSFLLFPQAKKDDKREEETGQPPREHVRAKILPPFFQRCHMMCLLWLLCVYAVCFMEVLDIKCQECCMKVSRFFNGQKVPQVKNYKNNLSNGGDHHPSQVERAKKKLQERRDEETPSSHCLKHKNTNALSQTRSMQMAHDSWLATRLRAPRWDKPDRIKALTLGTPNKCKAESTPWTARNWTYR